MSADPRRVKDLFVAALDLPDDPARRELLDRECGDDAELRRRLDGLLAAHDRPDAALGQPFAAPSADPDALTRTGAPGDEPAGTPDPAAVVGAIVAGRYKLLEAIGEGGMGSVWMAEQREPVKRLVAVKLIKPGMDSRTVLARFEAERQALALMDHPNIAKVLDGGTTAEGRPYFVMELVKGLPLTEYCDARRLSVRDRLGLFGQVCSAVQHAHQKGVIHRDLKPTNILVTEHDGKPMPKVIDFGLAKALTATNVLTDKTLHTAFGSVVGTPLYMAPEQVGINALDVDTRTDIYALGVILYELLTGTTPLEKKRLREAAWEEMRRLIREEEPPRPSTRLSTSLALPSLAANRQTEPKRLTGLVRGELDWIVMKALEKDRNRRYETASGLAMDVQRHLTGEPVHAVPPSAAYRLRKFARRNRGPVTAAAAVLVALMAGVAGTAVGLIRANDAAANARAAEASARGEAENARAAEAREREAAELARKREAEERAAKEKEKQARETAEAVAKFMQEVFAQGSAWGQASPTRGADGNLTVKAAMDHAAKSIAGRFPGRPDLEAAIRNTVGNTYRRLAIYSEAEKQLTFALDLREKALGPDHPDTLRSVHDLADLYFEKQYWAKGDYTAAEKLFKRALAGQEKALGPDHPDTLKTLGDLGVLYQAKGYYAAAEPLFKRALAGCEKAFGPDHPDTILSVANLSALYHAKGDLAAAEPLFRRALAGREKVLGPDHPDTLTIVNNLAWFYKDKKDFAAAVPLLKRAVAGCEKALGPNHPHTLRILTNLAELYSMMRRPDESIPLFEDALRRHHKVYGDEHPDTRSIVANLGRNYLTAGRATEAVPLLERAHAAAQRDPKRNRYPSLFGPRLLEAYVRAGRKADAARLTVELLAAARKQSPPRSPALEQQLAMTGRLLLPLDPAAAEPILRECLELREARNLNRWYTANAGSLLGEALLAQGKYAAAEPLLVAGYEGLLADAESPPAKRNLPNAADRLIRLYQETNRPAEAAKWRAERAKYPPEQAPLPRAAR